MPKLSKIEELKITAIEFDINQLEVATSLSVLESQVLAILVLIAEAKLPDSEKARLLCRLSATLKKMRAQLSPPDPTPLIGEPTDESPPKLKALRKYKR